MTFDLGGLEAGFGVTGSGFGSGFGAAFGTEFAAAFEAGLEAAGFGVEAAGFGVEAAGFGVEAAGFGVEAGAGLLCGSGFPCPSTKATTDMKDAVRKMQGRKCCKAKRP